MAKDKKSRDFSVVLATYTGAGTIDATFNSLLAQQAWGANAEVIVVIDGPNSLLRQKVKEAAKKFKAKNIGFVIKQLNKNEGRFKARFIGAKMARYDYILIVDDRVQLPDNFFKVVSSLGEEAVMPDVSERQANNFASFALNKLRRKLYGKNWNNSFEPYYIDATNFDKTPKGTTTFWINKDQFIKACEKTASLGGDSKNFNDDTRIIREIMDHGVPIYKTSQIRLTYEPRAAAKEELKHIFHRGPRFIDYYLKPGTRYYVPLLIFYGLLIPLIVIVVLWPILLLVALVATILISLWVAENIKNFFKVWLGLGAITLYFGAGLIYGLINKLRG